MTFKRTWKGSIKRALKGTAWFILLYVILWLVIAFIRFDLGIDMFPNGSGDGEAEGRFTILITWLIFVEYSVYNRGRL